ncbi:hypothetical protein ACHQM5_009219 [Ranunculus cassubicifolius]
MSSSSIRPTQGRKLVVSAVITILMMLILQASAIRLLSEVNEKVAIVVEQGSENSVIKNDDLAKKYFSGRGFDSHTTTNKGIEDSKRRVPSCPDPLHN